MWLWQAGSPAGWAWGCTWWDYTPLSLNDLSYNPSSLLHTAPHRHKTFSPSATPCLPVALLSLSTTFPLTSNPTAALYSPLPAKHLAPHHGPRLRDPRSIIQVDLRAQQDPPRKWRPLPPPLPPSPPEVLPVSTSSPTRISRRTGSPMAAVPSRKSSAVRRPQHRLAHCC